VPELSADPAAPGRATEAAGIGSLAIVLHSHMPYVEGFGTYPFGEEWLFDAFCRSYVPVLEMAANLTLTVTPVLADQLEAGGVAERLHVFAGRFRLGTAESEARQVDLEFVAACESEAARYRRVLERLGEIDGDLLSVFRDAAERNVELVPSAATHAVLPLLATTAGRRLQIDVGVRSHRRRFGASSGFWLPECAHEAALDPLLAERNISWFCTDQSAHEAPEAALRPVRTAEGPVAFTIDWEAVSWLWSLQGYPSDPGYADFHRKSLGGIRLWSIDGGAYDPGAAEARARAHALEFVEATAARLASFSERHERKGLLVFAVDTELLGHWWWEGPTWLEEVLRLAPEHGVDLVTLSGAVERHEPERRSLQPSTWGEHKDLSTWDSPEVTDLAWAARRLELRLLRALTAGMSQAAAERATRELLAVQSSDWAFLDKRGQAGDYPFHRATRHGEAFADALHSHDPSPRLRNLAPDLSLSSLREP
jgi:1,4-alpha-glucan branching enzyme